MIHFAANRRKSFPAESNGTTLVELLVTLTLLGFFFAIVGQILIQIQTVYLTQREVIRTQQDIRFAMNTLLRLLQVAGNSPTLPELVFQAVEPDPDGNAAWDSVRLRADWNPPDGDLLDDYEDVRFTTSNNTLFIQQATDPTPVEFVSNIASIQFQYFGSNGNPLADPVGASDSIARVIVTIQGVPSGEKLVQLSSQAVLRNRAR